MRVCVVVGARPEIIKMPGVIHELRARRADHVVIHTRQHDDENRSEVLFEELDLPKPDRNLDVGSGTQAEQTATALVSRRPSGEVSPDIVLVEGDTNTVLAAALAGAKLGIIVGHVEAGLRCGRGIRRTSRSSPLGIRSSGLDARRRVDPSGRTAVAPKRLSPIHTCTQAMATKTINLTEGAYARLQALKREGESFSDVIDRLTGKFALLELVGILDERTARGLRSAKREMGKRLRKGMGRTARGVA